jgi:hypothetical protein
VVKKNESYILLSDGVQLFTVVVEGEVNYLQGLHMAVAEKTRRQKEEEEIENEILELEKQIKDKKNNNNIQEKILDKKQFLEKEFNKKTKKSKEPEPVESKSLLDNFIKNGNF